MHKSMQVKYIHIHLKWTNNTIYKLIWQCDRDIIVQTLVSIHAIFERNVRNMYFNEINFPYVKLIKIR